MEKQLIFISRPNLSYARSIRRALPKSIVVFWKKGAVDLSSAKLLAMSCKKVYAENSILPEVYSELGCNVLPLEYPELDATLIKSINSHRPSNKRPIAFFASSDTIAKFLIPIANLSYKKSIFLTPKKSKEGARELLTSNKLSNMVNKIGLLEKIYPSVVVVGNDWTSEAKSIIEIAHRLEIPTICIQEGCLEWHDKSRRMQFSDFAFLQGPLTVDYLDRDLYFLTGNPKFDDLQSRPLPQKHLVMINCNFTYGKYENNRDQWITDVVRACRDLGLEFFISQHPRDNGALIGLPVKSSNATIVHDQIEESSILVSRFSTIIYESIRMGRQAIYYNPHHETMKTFEADETGGIYKAHTFNELLIALKQATSNSTDMLAKNENFLTLHCGTGDGLAALRCVESIQEIAYITEMSQTKQVFRRGWISITEKFSNDLLYFRRSLRKLRSNISKKHN